MGLLVSAAVTSSVVVFVHRERQEDDREIIYQVHSRREARHQDRQIGGQDTGELLPFLGFGAAVTGMIQVEALFMDVQDL